MREVFFTFSIFPIAMANGFFRIANGNLVYLATGLATTVVGWSYYFGHNVVWKQDLKKGLSSDLLELKRYATAKT